MTTALNAVFFLSGSAALIFETLFFRQAGLMLGNSVWSSSIVLASFMGGLALGNLGAARLGARLRRPLRAYAGLEVLIGVSGLALVLLFPWLTRALAPALAQVVASGPLLNFLRLALAFTLLLLPASAMGATLPLLVDALGGERARFGRTLGRLYGWNTLGAVGGALAGELLLIERFGLTGSGAVAATLNLIAALVAARLQTSLPAREAAQRAAVVDADTPGPARALLAAAGVAGALLLALEVIWFRFLLLFTMGTSAAFAIMLASVLTGIALGGLLGSAWLKRRPEATRALPFVALLAGCVTLLGYAVFGGLQRTAIFGLAYAVLDSGASALALTLPTSLLSGLLFTLLGQALRARLAGESRTAGLLTLANTLGAMLGAMAGGLLLLPSLGVENSMVALACGYALVAALSALGGERQAARLTWAGAAGLALTLCLFPYGLMQRTFLPRAWADYDFAQLRVLREGVTETAAYTTRERWGQPIYHRLVTNGHSMSSTNTRAARYMRLFSYLPLALRPQSESALVISFGLGSTADALTESESLRAIHVVDVSRDILELGRAIYPPPRVYPLDDPRVRVHVEDGRFFLLTTRERFDLITAEPPPPKNAGIVNLYSKEYFGLVRERLSEGGLASYWLPVEQLGVLDTRAILRGFCDAFEDCSLWTGYGGEWMLLGTRGARAPSEEGFRALWRSPRARASLEQIGFVLPEQIGTTFLADAAQLREWMGDVRPLEDDFPLRLSARMALGLPRVYAELMDPGGAQRRFAESAWVRATWPPALREATLRRFPREYPLLNFCAQPMRPSTWIPELAAVAGDPASRAGLLWIMQSSHASQRAAQLARARGVDDPEVEVELGVGQFADGHFLEAAESFQRVQRHVLREALVQWRVLALVLAGERQRAAQLVTEAGDWVQPQDVESWRFLSSAYGLPDPWPVAPAARAPNALR